MPTVWNNLPVAKLDPIFLRQINKLKDQARTIYTSTLLGNDTLAAGCEFEPSQQRKWQIPSAETWDLNLFHISGNNSIKGAYDRTCPNALYLRALRRGGPLPDGCTTEAPVGEGRLSDCQVEKIQIDYLAIQERAFRLRHASSIRGRIHSAARRRGHSPWNDAPDIQDMGGGIAPGPGDVAGPIGGIFTTMIRYLSLILKSGYNEGPMEIRKGATVVVTLPDGSVIGTEPP